MLQIWKLVDERKISTAEARLHISLARTILETLKVEIAAAHLAQSQVPSLAVTGKLDALPVARKIASGKHSEVQ
jgi:hypothetical protein